MTTAPHSPWIMLCSARLQELGPEIEDEHALDLARLLHQAWPAMTPKAAADLFLVDQEHVLDYGSIGEPQTTE